MKNYKEDITSPPAEGIYIYGLYLEGAAWDRRGNKLIETPSKDLFCQMPIVHIYAVNNAVKREDNKFYTCPIYKKPTRTSLTYVASVELRTTYTPEHWILRGVALLCDIK